MNASFGPFLVIAIGLLAGWGLRRTGRFSATAPAALNTYVISVALPALVLSQLPPFLRELASREGSFGAGLLFLPLIPWILFGLSIPCFVLLYRIGWIDRGQLGQLVLSAGLGNTSFVGLPLIEALLGPGQVPRVILLDQLGTFLALSLGGTLWISWMKSGESGQPKFSGKRFARDLSRFPPFVSVVLAVLIVPMGGLPEAWQTALARIGETLVPVAMVAVGSQIGVGFATFRSEGRALAFGLGYKLVLAPLVIFGLMGKGLGITGSDFEVGVLEAAMAPMITSTVLAMEAGFAPSLGALMLGIGIPLSLVTVPLWSRLL